MAIVAAGWLLAWFTPSVKCFAQTGERNFFEPLVTQDPNPSNELDIEPAWTAIRGGQDVSVLFSLEKQLSANISIELEDDWNAPLCPDQSACEGASPLRRGRSRSRNRRLARGIPLENGFGNLQLLGKFAFFASDRHEARVAIGLNISLPTGNPNALASTHTYYGPMLMVAKGMGDLPDGPLWRYLRPFALQADAYYMIKAGGTQGDDLGADVAISWQPYYLPVQPRNGIERELLRLTPFAEFSYDQLIVTSRGGTQPDLLVLPGVAYVGNSFQLSLATQVPMNTATVHLAHASVVAMLSLTLDRIWSGFGWTLF